MKKILLVFILVVVGILGLLFFFIKDRGIAGYNFFGTGKDPFADTNLPGDNGATNNATDTIIDYQPNPQNQGGGFLPRLVKIFDGPTSGFTTRDTTRTEVIDDEKKVFDDHYVYYIDRRTGYAFTYNIATKETSQVSNRTIPGILEAKFSKQGSVIVGTQIDKNDSVLTFTTEYQSKDGLEQLNPVYLDNNLSQVEVSPSGAQLAIGTTKNKKYELVVTNTNSLKGKSIFESPITEWDATWVNEGSILVQTKPASFSLGVSFVIDTKTGSRKRILSNEVGAKALVNPTKTNSYIYSTGGTSISLFLVSSSTKQVLAESTLVDKCVWEGKGLRILCARPVTSSGVAFPESWYKSMYHFRDIIVEINPTTGTTKRYEVPIVDSSGEPMDAINLTLSADGKKLFFMNKSDLSLWMLRLEQEPA